MQANSYTLNTQFAEDVKAGLTTFPKSLPSMYFYNGEGSRIFQQIMDLEEYYLTNCEYEILQTQKENILAALPKSFDLVELGAGDGLKTKILLKYFLAQAIDFTYMPVDISLDILQELEGSLANEMPDLSVNILHDDYFGALKKISNLSEKPKVVLFLGANIGNFSITAAEAFLKQLRDSLNKGDFLLLGADLVKNPETILRAYSDSKGVTANFNYNLLQRINDELNANFDITKFQHYATYNPETGETKSYLLSKEAQQIEIKALPLTIHFEAWESIYTEVSQKFSLSQIEKIAQGVGFNIEKHFFDSKDYFTDTLWKAL
ncbi:MAG: L-histidine N(alpha)-methyltransferase [Bacteroidia bacterium]